MATSETAARRRRGGWSVVDQALSSLSNMAVSVAVARAVGVREFGGFGVAYVVYTLVLGLTRALAAEPLTVRYSAADPAAARRAVVEATGAAVLIGAAVAVATLAIAPLTPSVVGHPLAALAVFLPGLMVQDVWRFAFVTTGRPSLAAACDLLWLALQTLLFLVVSRVGEPSAASYVAAWGLAATAAAVAASAQSRLLPAPRRTGAWLRYHGRLVRAFAFEFAARAGARQATISAVGAVSGLAALGAIRGGQVIFGPLNVVLLGAAMAAVPEAVRGLRSRSAALVASCDRLVLGLWAVCAGYTAASLLVPAAVGRALLGAAWPTARSLFPSQGALLASIAACSGYLVGLRASEDVRSSVMARALLVPVTVAGGVSGSLVDGARGLLLGLTAANLVGAAMLRRSLVRAEAAAHNAVRAPLPADRRAPTPRPPTPGP